METFSVRSHAPPLFDMNSTASGSAVDSYATANEPRRPIRAGTFRDEAWSKRHLLSLDGGGIRGYWTLLVLEKLIESIGTEEERHDAFDSFWPEFFPSNLAQHAEGPASHKKLRKTQRYLPCHYFDFICGSSTGGLIALMLGRFRMNVEDCRREYEDLSHRIFGKPRLVSQRTAFIVPWPKYSAQAMEEVFKEVTERRCEDSAYTEHSYTPPIFPSTENTCATLVTTLRRTKNEIGVEVETLYPIRSYDRNPPNPQLPNDTTIYNAAERLEIYQVARAATAAPMYFKEFKVTLRRRDGDQKAYFSDGGFGVTNNPTRVGFKEVKAISGSERHENVGVVVSIGTARGRTDPGGKSFRKRMQKMAGLATDPSVVAEWMRDQNLEHYWRLNDDSGNLHVELDEWKPNSWFTKNPGHQTLTNIRHAFNAWACQDTNIEAIRACARELVTQRRARLADRSRWQRFATGAFQYRCKHKDCQDARFDSLYQFEEHWKSTHEDLEDEEKWKEPVFKTWTYQKQNGRHTTRRR